ncbi:cupin domain-containing protein [Anaerostipes sp.]
MLSSYHNFEAPPHWHDDIELITVLQGKMEYNVNGEIVTIQQDEGIFINSR